jgi:alkanesulfonate monooxygenase SsuD/methylene tetrahydromethanopterin reductase-like flavin-dependent oxidoreductase (luciferase family)
VRRDPADWARFEVAGAPFAAVGNTEEELAGSIAALRSRLAFYGSTPAYRRVLETHGWADLGDRLHEMSRSSDPGRWAAMAKLIPEEMLQEFAVIGEPEQAAAALARRYDGLLDRYQVNLIGPSSLTPRVAFAVLIRQAMARQGSLPQANPPRRAPGLTAQI